MQLGLLDLKLPRIPMNEDDSLRGLGHLLIALGNTEIEHFGEVNTITVEQITDPNFPYKKGLWVVVINTRLHLKCGRAELLHVCHVAACPCEDCRGDD